MVWLWITYGCFYLAGWISALAFLSYLDKKGRL